MKITKATFITSVASADKFIKTEKPLVAVAGKSNVGKSSLINMLANNFKLAKTSCTPGRTRLVNYFDFGEFVLADLPGYGFAKVAKEEKAKWGKLLEKFFETQKIKLLISLVDIRHDPTSDDLTMANYSYFYHIPTVFVATKADKLSKTRVKPQLMNIASKLKIGISDMLATSAEKGTGKAELLSVIEQAISVKEETEKPEE